MNDRLIKCVSECWANRFPELIEKVNKAASQIDELLALEEHYRHAHSDKDRIQSSLGEFGSERLDTEALSSAFSRGDKKRTMSDERYQRIKKVAEELAAIIKSFEVSPLFCEAVSIEEDIDSVFESFDKQANSMAELFKTLRIAHLEVMAKYQPEVHDEFFKQFDWRSLENSEAALCPPFFLVSDSDKSFNAFSEKVIPLVSSGRPINVISARSRVASLDKSQEKGRASALKCSFNIETLPLLLRKVYVLQKTMGHGPEFCERVSKALFSPRPAVISLFFPVGEDAEELDKFAILSRAFPQFLFDPDLSPGVGSCMELFNNPEQESLWVSSEIEYVSQSGETEKETFLFTYADFILKQNGREGLFEEVSSDVAPDSLVLLADYLALSSSNRKGKTPFIYSVGAKGSLEKLVPSKSVLLETAERMELWCSLQELSGVRNPYVEEAIERLRTQLTAEKNEALAAQKAELEDQIEKREKQAVKTAMMNLAGKLSGMTGSGSISIADLGSSTAGSAAPTKSSSNGTQKAALEAAPEAADASDLPWIESDDCTSCDDCININKNIFTYNADKKSIIKNPRGGPFKDIVKAAEVCPALIIHPGKPLDPNEKDLDKWMKRAEKYQ